MPLPGVKDVFDRIGGREGTEVFSSRFDLDIPRLFAFQRHILETLRYDSISSDAPRCHVGGQPSANGVLEVKAPPGPRPLPAVLPLAGEASGGPGSGSDRMSLSARRSNTADSRHTASLRCRTRSGSPFPTILLALAGHVAIIAAARSATMDPIAHLPGGDPAGPGRRLLVVTDLAYSSDLVAPVSCRSLAPTPAGDRRFSSVGLATSEKQATSARPPPPPTPHRYPRPRRSQLCSVGTSLSRKGAVVSPCACHWPRGDGCGDSYAWRRRRQGREPL